DTLYLPLDTTPTSVRYEIVNNSAQLIEFGEGFVEEEFIEGIGWKPVIYKIGYYMKGDTAVFGRVTNMIQINLRPRQRWELSIPYLLPFHNVYQAGKRYRIVKSFNFQGEKYRKYYIWGELVVKEAFWDDDSLSR